MYIANSSGALLICAMTSSKLIILKYPLRSKTFTSKTTHYICLAAWALSPSFPVMNFIVDKSDVSFDFRNYLCDFRMSSSIWKWLTPVTTALFLVIPNCLVMATTINVLTIARSVASRGRQSLKWQGIMTTVLTATVYCISVLPYAMYRIGESVINVQDKGQSFFYTSFYRLASSFYSLNTISNFYIYSLTVASFREFLSSTTRQSYQILSNNFTSSSQGKR